MTIRFPIEETLPQLSALLAVNNRVVLAAPPGAGKTTRAPMALLEQPWLGDGKILMLEPRRLAARAAARFMAQQLGETVGETIGYRVRLDAKVGPKTRIEIVTEGILTRKLQGDPELTGVDLLIFDEFHERSLQADLGLALALAAQQSLREDLRILVMSATLDTGRVATLLGDAPVVASRGRSFPVETRYLDRAPLADLPRQVKTTVLRALREEQGGVLAFLPGEGEIRRTSALLTASPELPETVDIVPLFGGLSRTDQDAAIRPAPPGRRKVVLATSIAESSLTLDDIRIVVDAGYMRVPSFSPRTGMGSLETILVTQASADQRRGRAGRVAPGVCYRMWPEGSHAGLKPFSAPEILAADLAPLVLELAAWGVTDTAAMAWLDPPPEAAVAQARDTLTGLEAIDAAGRITAHGRRIVDLGVHPRLGHAMVRGTEAGRGGVACLLAALLGERDVVRGTWGRQSADVRLRLDLLVATAAGQRTPAGEADAAAVKRVLQQARLWQRRLGTGPVGKADIEAAGRLLAWAYPDRIGRLRAGTKTHYHLSNGRGAAVAPSDGLAGQPFLVAAHVDDAPTNARIFLAAPVDEGDVVAVLGDQLTPVDVTEWDEQSGSVAAARRWVHGQLVVREAPLRDPSPTQLGAAMLDGVRCRGLGALPWTRETRAWRDRVAFLGRTFPEKDWPGMDDQALLDAADPWLLPFLAGLRRAEQLRKLPLQSMLSTLLSFDQSRTLDQLAPTHLQVPSGSRIRLEYGVGETPVLAVRIQEVFGLLETPRVAGGRVAIVVHLLSPAQRPVQVTQDLAGFWANGYPQVRKDLRGRYPKHAWPEDPHDASPTRRTRSR